MAQEQKYISDFDLTKFGFVDDYLETKQHTISYLFYDIGRLSIKSKEGCGNDDIYIEDFFEVNKFIDIVFVLTGFKLKLPIEIGADRIDNIRNGDSIYSMNKFNEIIEWEVVSVNPNNNDFFIVTSKSGKDTKQVHKETLMYGGDYINYFGLTENEVLACYNKNTRDIINKLKKAIK